MPALVHFVKTDATVRTSTNTTAEELTNYTITWSDLTTAGFAAGDDVFIMVAVKTWNSSVNGNTFFAVGFGTTFAGRAEATSSIQRAEPATTTNGDQYFWIDRRTLVVNENIYFRGNTAAAGTASYDEFVCMILKLTGLTSNDFLYAEATHSGDAPNTDTDGASTTVPADGNWLLFGATHWLIDSTGANERISMRLNWGASSTSIQSEGEDTSDERSIGLMAYQNLVASTTTKIVYLNTGTALHDATDSMIFGLRLNIFENHDGVHTLNTITHSVLDTYQEFAGFPTFGLTTTGPFIVIGLPRHNTTDINKQPYGRIQIGGSDWPALDANRTGIHDNGASVFIGPILFGYNASQTSGTLDIDLDCAEDSDVSPTYTCDVQIAAAFSLTLAAASPTTGLLVPPISASMMSMLVR